ncbi:MAG: hypothetical protein KIS77_07710 [Saprospiraceae bacterium]|nr:hypothetical protein [Saprospiraceae bacterium]
MSVLKNTFIASVHFIRGKILGRVETLHSFGMQVIPTDALSGADPKCIGGRIKNKGGDRVENQVFLRLKINLPGVKAIEPAQAIPSTNPKEPLVVLCNTAYSIKPGFFTKYFGMAKLVLRMERHRSIKNQAYSRYKIRCGRHGKSGDLVNELSRQG